MLRREMLIGLVAFTLGCLSPLFADDVRYYEKDGVTYRETRHVIQRPVLETQTRESTQTVYRAQYSTQMKESVQERWVPVTDYRLESYWVGRWNPFVEPYRAQRYVPYTRWDKVTDVIKTPVTCRKLVPETRTVRVPVTTQRMAEEEVITRVAVSGRRNGDLPWTSPSGVGSPSSVAVSPPSQRSLVPVTPSAGSIGGMAQVESDPPRHGTATAWRAAETQRR